MHMNFQGFHKNLVGFENSDTAEDVTGKQFSKAEVWDGSAPINEITSL